MSASSGALYRVGTVNLVNGDPAIVGIGTSWLSALIAVAIGDLFTLDMKTWYEIISVDDDNNIVLDRGFEGTTANTTNYGIVRNTSGTVLTRIAGQIAVQFNQKQLFLDELRRWLNSTNAAENVTDSHGLTSSITTPTKMAADAQALIDANQVNIDTSVEEKIAAIRYGKLDNPLVHLFKKNKLVDTLKGELSWTRNSGATYIDSYGKLQYSPSPYAVNLLTYSEDFSNTDWSKNFVTMNIGVLGHNGFNNATEIIESGANGEHHITQSLDNTEPGYITTSTTVKIGRGEVRNLRIRCADSSGFVAGIYFDLETGRVTTPHANAITRVTPLPNGFYRFCCTWQTTGVDVIVGVYLVPSGVTNTTYVGNGSSSIIVENVQLEESRVANGYVKTEAISASGWSYVGIDVSRQEKEGWLFEGVSTNKIPNSLKMIDGTFSLTSSGTAAHPILTLDYEGDAVRIQLDLGGGTQSTDSCDVRPYYDNDIGGTDTFSFDVKSTDGLSNYDIRVDFNGNTADRHSEAFNNDGIVTVTGDWQRVWLSSDSIDTNTRLPKIRLRGNTNTSNTADIMIRYPQAEELPFASSFIPTTGTPATRAADVITAQAKDNFSPISKEMSVSFLLNPIGYSKSFAAVCQLLLGGNSFITSWSNNTLTTNYSTIERSDGSATFVSGGTIVPNVPLRISNYVKGDRHTLSVNGVVTNFDTDDGIGWETREADTLHITPTNVGFYGHINDYRYFDFALNDLEAAFLAGE